MKTKSSMIRGIKKFTFLIFIVSFIQGCSQLSVMSTPAEVIDSVARGHTVSQSTLTNPPETEEDLRAYFEVNAELWTELAKWFELIEGDE